MSIILDSPSAQHDFSRGPYWYHESPFLPIGERERNISGSPSLKDTATRRLLMDQSALKPELFEFVPWKIAKELWEYLGSRGKQTLLMWKILTTKYPERFSQISPSYCLRTRSPKLPLKGYLDIMRSDSCHWRAVLSISTAYASVADLVDIGNLKNLVALEINSRVYDSSMTAKISTREVIDLDDGVVRSWAEAAQSTGSLQNLQVLRICQQKSLSHHILWMLERLPRLNLVVIYQCDKITQEFSNHRAWTKVGAQLGGWNAQRLDCLDGQRKMNALKRLGPLSQVYQEVLSLKDTNQRMEAPLIGPNTSIMEFGLPALDCDDPEKENRRAQYAAKSILILTRANEQNYRKRAPEQIQQSRKIGKRTMKERGGSDMADMLGDFFGI